MKVSDVMTRGLQSIPRGAAIRVAAGKMRDLDVGMLPVAEHGEIVGTVTDRDITVRATALGGNPDNIRVADVMSNEIFTCYESDSLEHAARLMGENRIRRLMVQNDDNEFTGMLALADVARCTDLQKICGEIISSVSQPPVPTGLAH